MARTNERTCIECGGKLNGGGAFCTPAHKAAYHNRRAKRGALLLDVMGHIRRLAGKPEATVLEERSKLLWLKWEAEDKAAGRRSMTRALSDVQYDAELPREYEAPLYGLDG